MGFGVSGGRCAHLALGLAVGRGFEGSLLLLLFCVLAIVEERFADNGKRWVATLNNGRRKLNPESRNDSRVLELRVLTAGRICEYKTLKRDWG